MRILEEENRLLAVFISNNGPTTDRISVIFGRDGLWKQVLLEADVKGQQSSNAIFNFGNFDPDTIKNEGLKRLAVHFWESVLDGRTTDCASTDPDVIRKSRNLDKYSRNRQIKRIKRDGFYLYRRFEIACAEGFEENVHSDVIASLG